jgi:RND family efflux transporter MFP subunit
MKNIISIITLSLALCASCGQATTPAAVEAARDDHDEEITLTAAQMTAVDIRLGKVEARDLSDVIRANGQLALDPQKKAEVTSLVGGIVREVLVTEGTRVTAGQPVAYLENTGIVELQKEYLVLQKETLVAGQEHDRQLELSGQGAGVEKTLQQSAANHEIMRARLAGLEKQLLQLSISPGQVSNGNLVTRIPLKAPITGYINKIRVSTGSPVDAQTSLMNITDNTGIHCDVKVFEKDLHRVAPGQEVDITLTNQPSARLKGRVYEINNSFEEETKAILVHVSVLATAGARLLPGMYVTGLINAGKQKTDAVPNDAIVSKDGKKYIFALEDDGDDDDDGHFHFAPVEVITGITESGYTQITPVGRLDKEATIVVSNAFYISSASTDHGEHGH